MDRKISKISIAIVSIFILICVYILLKDRASDRPSAVEAVGAAGSGLSQNPRGQAFFFQPKGGFATLTDRVIDLFLNGPAASSCLSDAAKRMRTARINKDGIDALVPGAALSLNLFDDFSCTAQVGSKYSDVNGTDVVVGTIDPDNSKGTVYISTSEGRTVAFVEIPGEDRIFMAGTGNGIDYSIFEQDRSKLDISMNSEDVILTRNITLPDGTPIPEESSFQPPIIGGFPDNASAVTTIDVMFVYTAKARLWADANYQGPIGNILAIAVAKANTAFANSKIGVNLRLVHSEEIAFNSAGESRGNTAADLYSVTFNDAVRELRNNYGADIVTLVTAADDIGGLGWLFNGNPDFAFNVCRVKQLVNSYTYAHECGHNLGCGHSKAQTVNAPGYFSYSFGWQWTGADGKGYHSIMTYGSSSYPIDAPFFSNPSIIFRGKAAGDAKDANNALTILRLKEKVASFRDTVISQ